MSARRQIHVTSRELGEALPEGVLPEYVELDGLELTGEQAAAIEGVMLGRLTIQRLSRSRVAARTEAMPAGVWGVFEPDGGWVFMPEVRAAGR